MKTKTHTKIGLGLASVALLALPACTSKYIDPAITGATQVPGTGNLFRFCDGNTLIYYSNYEQGADEYEFIVYDGCAAAVPEQDGVQNLPDDE